MDAFDSLVDAELRELQGSAQTGVGAFLPGESPQDDFNRQQINGQQQSDAVVKKASKTAAWMFAALLAYTVLYGVRAARK
ncbi:MAG: hypothetical protein V3V10_07175 [Planctomycetota bacterium]